MQKSKKKIEPIPEEFVTLTEASDFGIAMMPLIIGIRLLKQDLK